MHVNYWEHSNSDSAIMELVVDANANENELSTELAAQGLDVIRARLDVGDVRIKSPSRTIVIERKTWEDYRQSISDGRKDEQELRALGSDSHFIYMIVSPKIPDWDGTPSRGIPNTNVFASLLKTQLRDGLAVHWAKNTSDMARAVHYLYRQLRDNKLLVSRHTRHIEAYVEQRKRKCADDNPLAQMLASVSGSSIHKGEAIAARYPTMEALVQASTEDIANIKVGKQKIGPALALKYAHILHGHSHTTRCVT